MCRQAVYGKHTLLMVPLVVQDDRSCGSIRTQFEKQLQNWEERLELLVIMISTSHMWPGLQKSTMSTTKIGPIFPAPMLSYVTLPRLHEGQVH